MVFFTLLLSWGSYSAFVNNSDRRFFAAYVAGFVCISCPRPVCIVGCSFGSLDSVRYRFRPVGCISVDRLGVGKWIRKRIRDFPLKSSQSSNDDPPLSWQSRGFRVPRSVVGSSQDESNSAVVVYLSGKWDVRAYRCSFASLGIAIDVLRYLMR